MSRHQRQRNGQKRTTQPPNKQAYRKVSTPIPGPQNLPEGLLQRAEQAPETLRPAEVIQLQRAVGNQAASRLLANPTASSSQTDVVQRTLVTMGNAVNYTRGFINLREQPGKKGKKLSRPELRHSQALKLTNDQPVSDQDQPSQEWYQVEVMSGESRGVGGYLPVANFNSWGQMDDTKVGHITADTFLRATADKKGAKLGALQKDTSLQVVEATPTNGYLKVR